MAALSYNHTSVQGGNEGVPLCRRIIPRFTRLSCLALAFSCQFTNLSALRSGWMPTASDFRRVFFLTLRTSINSFPATGYTLSKLTLPQPQHFKPLPHSLQNRGVYPQKANLQRNHSAPRASVRLRCSYSVARRIQQEKQTNAEQVSCETKMIERESLQEGGREEGGQVPHSVRSQAPARQRGSVSP